MFLLVLLVSLVYLGIGTYSYLDHMRSLEELIDRFHNDEWISKGEQDMLNQLEDINSNISNPLFLMVIIHLLLWLPLYIASRFTK